MKCENELCNNIFEPKLYNQKFCCARCRNNQKQREWRKRKILKCSCGNDMYFGSKLCHKCNRKRVTDIGKETTLEEYHNLDSVKGKHPSWKNAHIRGFARSWNKEKTKLPCHNCGYHKHVELAHIKEIKSFPVTATIGEINNPSNLVQLCPNCHWELDHGLLVLSGAPTKI